MLIVNSKIGLALGTRSALITVNALNKPFKKPAKSFKVYHCSDRYFCTILE
jgi:hypothetical protein